MDTLTAYEDRTLTRLLRWTVFQPHPTLGDECWVWTGTTNRRGYGYTSLCEDWDIRKTLIHRWAWLTLRGPIPGDLEPDHLCERQPCWNVNHLELVTHLENTQRWSRRFQARKTHCAKGLHPWTADNIGSENRCQACNRANAAAWLARRRETGAVH